MGAYVVSIQLLCSGQDGEVLKRFAEIDTIDDTAPTKYMTPLTSILFEDYDPPDTNGNAPAKLLTDIHAAIHAAFEDEMLADLATGTGMKIEQVDVFSSWSPPQGVNPHEGQRAPIKPTLRDAQGNLSQVTWKIVRGTETGTVDAYCQWRYFGAVV
jgi:hypothetical protein